MSCCVCMQLAFHLNEVGVGANGLKHVAKDYRGESSSLNTGAVSPRWLMREMWGWR